MPIYVGLYRLSFGKIKSTEIIERLLSRSVYRILGSFLQLCSTPPPIHRLLVNLEPKSVEFTKHRYHCGHYEQKTTANAVWFARVAYCTLHSVHSYTRAPNSLGTDTNNCVWRLCDFACALYCRKWRVIICARARAIRLKPAQHFKNSFWSI